MAKEQKHRKPVFQSSDETEPVRPNPPFQPAEDDSIHAEPEVLHDEIDATPTMEIVEERVHATGEEDVTPDVLKYGWRRITPAQQNGKTFIISDDIESDGTTAYWRKTRVLNHNRWVTHGRWSHSLTRADIHFEPLYYREI